ncbi:MAG: FAD-dependent oxidoreductase, partial [Anaerovoracaceae bacterium]
MENYLPNFKQCLQKEPPFCTAACPFQLDVLDFIEKMQRGSFDAAYKTYKNAVGFPEIACRLCQAPCQTACALTSAPIDLLALERAAIQFAKKKKPQDYNLPQKNKRIAIVGGGISGLACALRLATKKYAVTVYEASSRIGGSLWSVLDPALFLDEFAYQFQFESYDLQLNTTISSLEDLASFDGVYLATGKGGEDFGLCKENPTQPCMQLGTTGVFAGGGLLGHSPDLALRDGLLMSTTIDNFLKTGNLLYTPAPSPTKMVLDSSHLCQGEKKVPP